MGTSNIPSAPVTQTNRYGEACGTNSGFGWLNATIPAVGGLASGFICFNSDCSTSSPANVVQCPGYLIYSFPSPSTFPSQARVCTTDVPPPTGNIAVPPQPPPNPPSPPVTVLPFTPPSDGTATRCYQGISATKPIMQALLAYAGGSTVAVGLHALIDTYNWIPPSDGAWSAVGGIESTETGTTTGLCMSLTLTCELLDQYTSVFNFGYGSSWRLLFAANSPYINANNLPHLPGYLPTTLTLSQVCDEPLTLYLGMPSAQPYVDLLNYASADYFPSYFLPDTVIDQLNPVFCSTDNCNQPASIPIPPKDSISCPGSGAATTCNWGIMGDFNATVSGWLHTYYQQYHNNQKLIDAVLDATSQIGSVDLSYLPDLPLSAFSGGLTSASVGSSSGVCLSTSVTCRQLFSYVAVGSAPFLPNSVFRRGYVNFPESSNISGYAPLAALLYWDQFCPLDSTVTLYSGLQSKATCASLVTAATHNPFDDYEFKPILPAGFLYGTAFDICGSSDCNTQRAPSSPPPPPAAAPPSDWLQCVLTGYSITSFTAVHQLAFILSVASALQVPSTSVLIASFSTASISGRRLLSSPLDATSSSIVVVFTVYSSFSAGSLVDQLTNNATLSTALASTFSIRALDVPSVSAIAVYSGNAPVSSPSNKNAIISGLVGGLGGAALAVAAGVVYVRMRRNAGSLYKPEDPADDLAAHLLGPGPAAGPAGRWMDAAPAGAAEAPQQIE